jgi:hypothetical protein
MTSPLLPSSELPPPVNAWLGVLLADPATEPEAVVLAPGLVVAPAPVPVPEAGVEDAPDDVAFVVDPAEVLDLGAVELPLALGLWLEPELGLDPAGATTPPCTFPDELEVWVPAAADLYAARVLPDEGALMAPTMPAWQWPGVLQKK